LLGHRERAIKCGWKHGITGIENADSENTSVFFQSQKKERDQLEADKAYINNKRLD